MANTARAFANQAGSKRRRGEAGDNGPVGSPGLYLAGRRALQADAQVVQTSRPRQARIQGCIQNALPLLEQSFGMLQSQALDEVLGSDTRPGGKEAMQMKWAQASSSCQERQVRLFRVVLVQELYHPGHTCVVVHEGQLATIQRCFHPILARNKRKKHLQLGQKHLWCAGLMDSLPLSRHGKSSVELGSVMI